MTLLSSILPNFVGHTICSQQFNLRLLEVLGTGAYGVVYLAHNTTPGRGDYPAFYAVKCLLKYEEGSQLAANQEREILYHKLVSHHPNIITLHEVIHEEHFTFLVMDFCLGGDLFSAITERQIYHRNDIAIKHTFLQLLDAIEFCQSKQVYHRDLKPENILYSADDGQVCVTDFGLSTRADVSTTFGCGSSCYMSPECVGVITSGLPFSTAISDIWSLGIILVNMVTGRNPWHIASPAQDEGFRQFLQEGAPYLQRSLPISKDAARLFVSILEPDPATRITIPQLRKSVKEIPSFYRTPGDHHPSLTSLSKPSSLPHNEESRWYNCALTSATMFEVSFHAHQPSPSTASIVAIAPSTGPEFSTITNQSSLSTDVDLDDFPVPPPLTPGGNSGSHSDADSEGPTTPVTRVHEPEVQVPDDFVLGGVNEDPNIKVVKQVVRPGGLQKQSLRKLWTSISPPPRFSRPVQKFVDAVQRVKVLGS